MDVVTALRQQKMSAYRWYAVGLCVLCGAIDGLDLLLVSYALPHLPEGFSSGEQKGLLISLGFVGYGIGAAFIAPLADRIGRKTLVVGSLLFACLILAGTTFSPNVEVLMFTRLLTGIGVGTMLPLAHVLGDEYATESKRSLAVGFVTLGFPIGSFLGGMISLLVISQFAGSWQALFWFGAIVSAAATVLMWLTLPESPAFLVRQGTTASADRIAVIVRRMKLTGVDPTAAAPANEPSDDVRSDEKIGVLSPKYRLRSLVIWGGYTCGIMGYYFINSWTPQLITTASGSAETGALMATVISLGAITGGLTFAFLTLKFIPTKMCWIALGAAVVAQVTFALTLSGGIAYISAIFLGMGMQAGLSAYMTSSTRLYPTAIRARALGLMGGISRVGSITAPLLVGALLTVLTARTMYLSSAVIVLVAGLAAFVLWSHTKLVFDRSAQQIAGASGSQVADPPLSRA